MISAFGPLDACARQGPDELPAAYPFTREQALASLAALVALTVVPWFQARAVFCGILEAFVGYSVRRAVEDAIGPIQGAERPLLALSNFARSTAEVWAAPCPPIVEPLARLCRKLDPERAGARVEVVTLPDRALGDLSPCPCRRCGGPVEEARLCYAQPTCYACLPPPEPLPVTPPPESLPVLRARVRHLRDRLANSLDGNPVAEVLPVRREFATARAELARREAAALAEARRLEDDGQPAGAPSGWPTEPCADRACCDEPVVAAVAGEVRS